jgi:hypothetical protein
MRYLVFLLFVLNNSCLFSMTAPDFVKYKYTSDASWRETSQEVAVKAAGYDYLNKAYQNSQYVLHSFPYFERDLSECGVVVSDRAGGRNHYDLFFVGAVTYPQDERYNPCDDLKYENLSGKTKYGHFVVGYDDYKKRVVHRYFNWYASSGMVMQQPEVNEFLGNLNDIQKAALCAAIVTCRTCMKKNPHGPAKLRNIDDKNRIIPVKDFDGLIQSKDSITGATFTILKKPAIDSN